MGARGVFRTSMFKSGRCDSGPQTDQCKYCHKRHSSRIIHCSEWCWGSKGDLPADIIATNYQLRRLRPNSQSSQNKY
ncbi:hypothetical protein FHG87_005954 [Trinorchestia longiramus]|nr:hypothetical protein FHG87_005954 [Trinorchestia longiramus]